MQPEKYDVLFGEYKNRLYRFALRIVKDSLLAEDVVQEVHVKCWQNRDSVEAMANPGAWMMRVTKNLCIDKIRSRHSTTDLDAVSYNVHSHDPVPDSAAEMGDLMQVLRETMETLPPKQKLVFHLREIEGMQYKEISEILNITVDEVKINLFRARQKVKDKLISIENYGLSKIHSGTA
ncbi:MAG TPA: sigma-70 family RNA polymerase sigma factor [Saprospiraceae bacterium]|nr:sigma-70 family RNA polymerase sigma factor [Saprospiraceae bacterium]